MRRGGPSDRIERKQTHMATGTPVIIRGRKVCQKCAEQRRQRLAASKKQRP